MTWLRTSSVAIVLLGAGCQNNSIDLEMTSAASADDGTASDGTSGASASASASADATATVPATATATDTTPQPTTTSPGTVTTTAPDTGPILDIGGDGEVQIMLLAVSTVVDVSKPLQGIVWMERAGGDAIDLTLQWLSLDVGSTTEPRELVGDVYFYPGVPIAPDGSFVWDTGVILVPGEANPITGSDLVVSASMAAYLEGSPYCGSVGGQVTSPIMVPLDGSTHAMTTVEDETTLPLDFPMSCL